MLTMRPTKPFVNTLALPYIDPMGGEHILEPGFAIHVRGYVISSMLDEKTDTEIPVVGTIFQAHSEVAGTSPPLLYTGLLSGDIPSA